MIRRTVVATLLAATAVLTPASAGAQAPPDVTASSSAPSSSSASTTTAAAAASPGPTTTMDPALIGPGALGRIVPEPDSGRAPTLEGERGTTSQLVVFLALVGGLSVIGALVWRDARRSRSRSRRDVARHVDAQTGATSTRSEPVADSSTKPPSSSARQ